ncbi:P-loop containing nucleoside triphosphate hydrolase protein [Microdochium bolleyi]|uniref:p-loop containing nucleoside triphosphate hydrolase protein n=1 Tax=Microdochium bolleyi TaxID=196109 RepID=A0A136J811_9PEZI|nr:P-loop containing nucleoside triphosphate hydrolase protein [Microdochium bolleyi]
MASSNDGSESYVVVGTEQAAIPETVATANTDSVVAQLAKQTPEDSGSQQNPADDAKEDSTQKDSEHGGEDGDEDSDEEGEEEEKEPVVVGMVCGSKDLYQKIDEWNNISWTTKYPDGLEEAAEDEDTARYALLVRNKKSYDSRKKLEIDSIVIQSPLLKEALQKVLKAYPGVTTTLARLTFAAPFRPFVHRWPQFTEALADEEHDEATKEHLKLLHDVLHAELKDTIAAVNDYIKNKVITYEHVWAIFHPGSIISATRYGQPVATQLHQGEYAEHCRFGNCFQLKCERVDWDGTRFGFVSSAYLIPPFSGTTSITDLDCYPLEYHLDKDAITAKLIERGRKFEALAGYNYRRYDGQAIEQTSWGPSKLAVNCRIVVDSHAHAKANPDQQLTLRSLQKLEAQSGVHSSDSNDNYYNNSYDSYNTEGEQDVFLAGDKKPMALTEEQLLLCTPVVRGYALKTKKWLELFVDEISDIEFDDKAFDALVLPEGHKSLILAFTQSQVKNKHAFDDVISGKGRGIIMLLSGGPGIGKTLTAESVAETMRVPLYSLTAGDLPEYDLETKLSQALELVAKWDAVLLLDECDVFLQARSPTDLARNRVVSIFLRTLEYYEGILFMTTNRMDDIDEAFHSRIHISLQYPNLDHKARSAVWQGFLDRDPNSHVLSAEDVSKLAALDMNGRVIKNVLKTSNLLACHRQEKLNFEHLKTVLNVQGQKIPE